MIYLLGAERDLERERSGRRGGGDLLARRLGGDLRGGGDLARLPGGGDLYMSSKPKECSECEELAYAEPNFSLEIHAGH